jgi:hypothetical protein
MEPSTLGLARLTSREIHAHPTWSLPAGASLGDGAFRLYTGGSFGRVSGA